MSGFTYFRPASLVGAGDEPCAVLMIGSRTGDWTVRYSVSELAARHGASVERETSDPDEAYARWEPSRRDRPSSWDRLALGLTLRPIRGGRFPPVHDREVKPFWTSATFLVYTGGLTVLLGGLTALQYLSHRYGSAAKAGWALLVLAILYAVAHALRLRGRQIAAGIFAFASVIAWAAFIVFLFQWWGWDGVNGSFKHFSLARLVLWLLILAAAFDDRRRFGFPFIRLISAVVGWLFVVDLVTAGGSFTAAVTLLVGVAYLVWGTAHRTPSSFWLHLVGGLLIGGSILYWAHTGDGEWAAVSIAALCFVLIAYATRRSSWAVLGTIGFFAATVHYLVGSPTDILGAAFAGEPPPHVSPWAPALAFGLLGFFLVSLGLLGRRRMTATLAPPPAAPTAE